MSRLARRTLSIAVAGLVASWLLLAGDSPLSDALVSTPSITNAMSAVNLPTVMFAMAGFPGTRAPADALVALVAAVQWLIYGLAGAGVWNGMSAKRATRPPVGNAGGRP